MVKGTVTTRPSKVVASPSVKTLPSTEVPVLETGTAKTTPVLMTGAVKEKETVSVPDADP